MLFRQNVWGFPLFPPYSAKSTRIFNAVKCNTLHSPLPPWIDLLHRVTSFIFSRGANIIITLPPTLNKCICVCYIDRLEICHILNNCSNSPYFNLIFVVCIFCFVCINCIFPDLFSQRTYMYFVNANNVSLKWANCVSILDAGVSTYISLSLTSVSAGARSAATFGMPYRSDCVCALEQDTGCSLNIVFFPNF